MQPTTLLSAFLAFFLSFVVTNASAGITFENPRGKSKWTGGKVNAIKWKESGNGTALASIGTVTASLYAGSEKHKTYLASLGSAPATALRLTAKIPADVGPDGKTYFIQFVSSSGEVFDTQKFALEKMTGQFNATVLATIHSSNSTTSLSSSNSTGTSSTTGVRTPIAASNARASTSSNSTTSDASRGLTTSILAAVPLMAAAVWTL